MLSSEDNANVDDKANDNKQAPLPRSLLLPPPPAPPPIVSIPNLIRKREHGFSSTSGRHHLVTPSERWLVNDVFLPNTVRIADRTQSKLCCGVYSADGNRFLSIVQRSMIRIYDTSTTNFIRSRVYLGKNVGWTIDGAFSPCGRYVLYYTWPSRTIFACDIEATDSAKGKTQEEDQEHRSHRNLHHPRCPDHDTGANNHTPIAVHTKTHSNSMIFSLKLSEDGRQFLAAASDCTICLHDIESEGAGETLRFHGHRGAINTVAFADASSQMLFSGGEDGLCKVWDRRCLRESQPRPVGVLCGHKLGVTYIDSKMDGRQFVSNSKDQTAKLWDIRFSKDKEDAAACRGAQAVQRSHTMWDFRNQAVPASLTADTKPLANDASVVTFRGHVVRKTLIRCRFSPSHSTGQRYVYAGCATGRVLVYSALTGRVVRELGNAHRDCVRDVHWHPHRAEIASSSLDGALGVWTYVSQDLLDESEGCCCRHPLLRAAAATPAKRMRPGSSASSSASSSSGGSASSSSYTPE